MTKNEITTVPPGWKITVELEGITWTDLARLAQIAEAMGFPDGTVIFEYDEDQKPIGIVLEDV